MTNLWKVSCDQTTLILAESVLDITKKKTQKLLIQLFSEWFDVNRVQLMKMLVVESFEENSRPESL